MKKDVYTSLQNLFLKNCNVKDYTLLSEEFAEWVSGNTIKLLLKRNKSEIIAGEELKKIFPDTCEQVFFMIKRRSYFLDFFVPRKNMAIEIDGSYHKNRREEDKLRDADFAGIGITTVRIKSKDVLDGRFIEKLKECISKTKTKHTKAKRSKTKQTKAKQEIAKEIKEAKRRLREHDKKKHLANWI